MCKYIYYCLSYDSQVKMPDYVGGTFRCSICAKEFLTMNDTKNHIKDTHADEVTVVVE